MTTRTKVTLYKTDFWVDHEDCPIDDSGLLSITLNQDITEVVGLLCGELKGELAHMINVANRPVQYTEHDDLVARADIINDERKAGY